MRHDEKAKAILVRLSKNGVGCAVAAETPTTLVGTKVFRGGDAPGIIAAIKQQHDWKSP